MLSNNWLQLQQWAAPIWKGFGFLPHGLVVSSATKYTNRPVSISSAWPSFSSFTSPPFLIISCIITEPGLSIISEFSICCPIPSETQMSLAQPQENRMCLMSSASTLQTGQFTMLVICLFAWITWHGIQPCKTRHANILILLGMESFQSLLHTEPDPDGPGIPG